MVEHEREYYDTDLGNAGRYAQRKANMVDEIYVINAEGYIGVSMVLEIEYVKTATKPVRYLEEIQE